MEGAVRPAEVGKTSHRDRLVPRPGGRWVLRAAGPRQKQPTASVRDRVAGQLWSTPGGPAASIAKVRGCRMRPRWPAPTRPKVRTRRPVLPRLPARARLRPAPREIAPIPGLAQYLRPEEIARHLAETTPRTGGWSRL